MRKKQPSVLPSALACGLLEDGERALFLVRIDEKGQERLEMPCVEVMQGENPVAALATAFRAQTGIDAQVHGIKFERRHNAGTRKRRALVPALVFELSAKSHAVKVAPEFSGYRWLEQKDLMGRKLAKKAEWLRT
jgi:hypothetical protein